MRNQVRTARQIATYFVIFYTVATVLLGLAAYAVGARALSRQTESRIGAEADLLRHIHDESGLGELQAALLRRDNRGVNNLGYLLVNGQGRQIGGQLGTDLRLAPGWRDIQFHEPDGEINDARALTITLDDGSSLTIAAETASTQDMQHTFVLLFLAGFALMLVGGLAGGLLLGRAIRHRIKGMNDTATAIIGGDLDQRVPVSPQGDEFASLATTLNRMLDRNSRLIANLRQVSSDIAHDLRTPIALLRQRLERAALISVPDEAVHREIESAIQQSDAILSLFSALLRISEVESGALRQYFRPVDMSALIRSTCESYVPAAEDKGHILRYAIEPDINIHGDEELIAQALVNLLENALRHTPEGSTIKVHLSRCKGSIELAVADDGPGLPEADLPKMTQRFTRLDRARAAPGYGLGLNLVAAIVQAHDGELSLSANQPGLCVQMLFIKKGELT